jgi:hypothetical protein
MNCAKQLAFASQDELMKFQLSILVVLVSLGSVQAQPATATLVDTEAAVTLTNPRTGVGAGEQTRGFTFTLDAPRIATHLGMNNFNGSGEADFDRRIGLWNDAGTLVADLTILAGPTGEVDGGFIYGELAAPVALLAGELYTAGVWYSDNNSPGLAFAYADVTGIPGFNYMDTVETGPPGGAFEKPTIVRDDRLNGYFGPNIRFSTAVAAAVPEPAGLGILLLMGLVGFGHRRRRRSS